MSPIVNDMETALITARVLGEGVVVAAGLGSWGAGRQAGRGPMGWAADVTDVEFRTVGLLEVLGALAGWCCREH